MSGISFWLGLFFVSCALAIDLSGLPQGDTPLGRQKNSCAMSQVLEAMNELLTTLSAEVRHLGKQVKTSCGVKDPRGGRRRPPSSQRRPEFKEEKDEEVKEDDDFGPDEDFDDIFDTFGREPEEEKEAPDTPGFEYDDYDFGDGDGESPANELINDLSNWWDSIVPFAKPTDTPTTTEVPPQPPFPDYYTGPEDRPRTDEERYGYDDRYGYDEGRYSYDEEAPAAVDEDGPAFAEYEEERPRFDEDRPRFDEERPRFDKERPRFDEERPRFDEERFEPEYTTDDDRPFIQPDYGYPYQTTTPQPQVHHTIPPEPTTCPTPFHNQAGGCFLVFHDQRDWRSWGEAHAFCQNYGGTLAAPYRLKELQDFLSRYYSDAFWVGAKFDVPSRSWKWLNGWEVEQTTWMQGQPSRNQNMKCIFLERWSGYKARNFFCGEKYPFICDYRGPEYQ